MRASLLGLVVVTGLLALPFPAAAAGSCDLATSTSPGHVITVSGSGFTAGAAVDITQTWSGSNATVGGNTGPQTTTSQVTADASGAFTFTIDAGPGHGGTYDLKASDGTCTATTQAVAVETAGGVNHGTTGGTTGGAGGATPTPPATDTVDFARGTSVPLAPVIAAFAGLALLGVAWVVRRAQRA